MIDKIGHYSLENPASIYDEEAMTALELAGRTAKKVNEVIDQSNKLVEDTTAWMEKTTNETIPNEVDQEVQEHIINGDFDKQIDKSIGNLSERVNNLLGAVVEGSTTMDAEVIDLRTGLNGHVDANAGEGIRNQLKALYTSVGRSELNGALHFTDMVTGSVYATTTGAISNGAEWRRSRHLLPCGEHILFRCSEKVANDDMMLVCYDKELVLLGTAYPVKNGVYVNTPKHTPTGTCYVGLNVTTTNTAETFTMHPLSMQGVGMIEAPADASENDNFYYVQDNWVNQLGYVANADSFDAVVFPVDSSVKWATVPYKTAYNVICFDGNNNVISNGTNVQGGGRWGDAGNIIDAYYEIPAGTVRIGFTIQHAKTHGDNSSYIALTREKGKGISRLDGKRVMAIGDSVVYLDSLQGYDGATCFAGWQRQLRKLGALVYSYGYSGFAYATGATSGDGSAVGSIYDEIVTKGVDVSGYDVVILFAGLNDMLYYTATSTLDITSYDNIAEQLPTTQAVGALCRIIQYIKANNPEAEIYLCQPSVSNSDSRELGRANQFDIRLETVSKAMCIPYIRVARLAGLCPGLNWEDTFTYDGTHPNRRGMAKIGNAIARYIEAMTE